MRATTRNPRRGKKLRAVCCCSREYGRTLLHQLATVPILKENVEIVAVYTDNPGKDPDKRVWSYDNSPDLRALVPREAQEIMDETGKEFPVIQRKYDNQEMLSLIDEIQPDVLLSAVFGGIFKAPVLERFRYKFNFHPSGYQVGQEKDWIVPKRYQGAEAIERTYQDVEKRIIQKAVVAMHELVVKIDQGPVAAWSRPSLVHLLPASIPSNISDKMRRQMVGMRLRVFFGATSILVAELAEHALPYHLGLTEKKPDLCRSRSALAKASASGAAVNYPQQSIEMVREVG